MKCILRLRWLPIFGVGTILSSLSYGEIRGGHNDIVSFGSNGFNGVDIAQVINANPLYGLGYTGSRAVIANIEAGTAWGSHEVFNGKTITNFSQPGPFAPVGTAPNYGGAIGDVDRHATWVGHNLTGGGSNVYQRGIAYGATLWNAGIATQFFSTANSYSGSFVWSDDHAPVEAYRSAMLTGVGGSTADVVNSSWGFTLPTGNDPFVRAIDKIIEQSGKVTMFSAGNSGPGANTVGGVGAGYNAITVGATGPGPAYNAVASFSSRGLNDYYNPVTNTTTTGVRARVDVLAPGQSLTLAFYGGSTGGNFRGSASGGVTSYSGNVAGTSFSSPTTAASAALLVDVAKDKGLTNGKDQRVMKSLLMTGADHLSGWNNQTTTNISGVAVTSQVLDAAQGAGQINVFKSYGILTGDKQDLAGLGGGFAGDTGWDMGQVSQGGFTDYVTDYLAGGSTFTATLNWFVHNGAISYSNPTTVASGFGDFNDLSLELYSYKNGVMGPLIAKSDGKYLTSEYLFFTLPPTLTQYVMRVKWEGSAYNFNGSTSEQYGLAWAGTQAVPEPASMSILAVGVLAALKRRKKQS